MTKNSFKFEGVKYNIEPMTFREAVEIIKPVRKFIFWKRAPTFLEMADRTYSVINKKIEPKVDVYNMPLEFVDKAIKVWKRNNELNGLTGGF